jgi:uncharacterized membrane protein
VLEGRRGVREGRVSGRRLERGDVEAAPMRGRWETTRTEAFSDGVFSIASTLLVLDIVLRRGVGSERAAVIFYGASLLVIALLFSALWREVTSDRQRLEPELSDAEVQAIGQATTPNIGLDAAVMVVAVLVPRVAAFGYLAIAVVAVARARGDPTDERSA